jgi:hypothetical protein
MKNVPLIGNMSRDGSHFDGGGFGQLLNDEEGTECVIDDHRQRNHPSNDPNEEGDQQYHPPMCGQAFISKVIGQGSNKKKKSVRGMLSPPNRNPMLFLRKNNTKSSLGYHETFSLEQPQDSESESGTTSHHSRSIGRLKSVSMDQEEGTPPPYIVQFDPHDLTLIRTEKEQSDAKKIMPSDGRKSLPNTGSKKGTVQSLLKGKHIRKSSASSSSPFCPIVLPTVTEEKSFDLQDDKSAATEPDALPLSSPCHVSHGGNLLPSVSSTSSSSCSSFFGRVNSTEEDSRDDLENIATIAVPPTESVPRESRSDDVLDEDAASVRPMSPEMMQILTAMRQIILKQQDAIQAISKENFEFRHQLALCHEEMQTIKTESAEQLIQITQLVIQKQGLEAETTRLKAELEGLRQEVSALKLQEDVDLADRFESLMADEEEEEENDDDKSDAAPAVEDAPQRAASPTINLDRIVDDTSWRRLISSFDSSSSMDGGVQKSPPPQRHTPTQEENSPALNDSQRMYSLPPSTPVEESDPTMGQSFSSSGSVADLLPGLSSSMGSSTTPDRARSEDVVEFKSRLEEIQKKRMLRGLGPGRKSPSVRFA